MFLNRPTPERTQERTWSDEDGLRAPDGTKLGRAGEQAGRRGSRRPMEGLSRCRWLGGIMLLSKARARDFVGNKVPDSMIGCGGKTELLSSTTVKDAETWDWSEAT